MKTTGQLRVNRRLSWSPALLRWTVCDFGDLGQEDISYEHPQSRTAAITVNAFRSLIVDGISALESSTVSLAKAATGFSAGAGMCTNGDKAVDSCPKGMDPNERALYRAYPMTFAPR